MKNLFISFLASISLSSFAESLPALADKVSFSNTKVIATSLISKLKKESKGNTGAPTYDFQSETSIMIQFKDEYIKSIQRNCFLNQHQTRHSAGGFGPQQRAEIEDHLLGLKLEQTYRRGKRNPVNELRPKYAYVMIHNPNEYIEQSLVIPQYGNVFAIFKQDIKNRSSFTSGDSLEEFIRGNQQKALNFGRHEITTPRGFLYWEAQIWGKTCFDDVEYFLVNCPGLKPINTELRSYLKRRGHKTYECKKDEMSGMFIKY
jgi:hypothetical protein